MILPPSSIQEVRRGSQILRTRVNLRQNLPSGGSLTVGDAKLDFYGTEEERAFVKIDTAAPEGENAD